MAFKLTTQQHFEIFSRIKSSFSDFHLFDYLVAEKLKQAITDSNSIEINMKTTKKVAERYFDVESFKTPEQKLVWAQIQLIFKACYVLMLSYQEYPASLFLEEPAQLLEYYPSFAGVDEDELQLLFNFRNMLKVTLLLIPARLNKQCILKIAGRLEGSQNEYITGGGQKPAVTRRVTIYEREGGIVAEKRPDRTGTRIAPAAVGAVVPTGGTSVATTGYKRSATALSDKKIKLVRLETEEMRQLSKAPINPFPGVLPGGNASSTTTSAAPSSSSAASTLEELFLSPLSALSVAASRMLNAKGKQASQTAAAGAGAGAAASSSSVASGPAPAAVTAAMESDGAASIATATANATGSNSATMGTLRREVSDPINSFLGTLGGSDSEFWKETLGDGSKNVPLLQRNSSLGISDINFSEDMYQTAAAAGAGGQQKDSTAAAAGATTVSAGKAATTSTSSSSASTSAMPTLNRGFSLGFYSNLSEDIRNLTSGGGISVGSPRSK